MHAQNNHHLFIGVMSGTSLDGVDVALVDFKHRQPSLVASKFFPYQPPLIERLINREKLTFSQIAMLDVELGGLYADCINTTLKTFAIDKSTICAIGLHGQTIDHDPQAKYPYTIQIGNASTVAYKTGILTVADFRSKDIAAGGQGAPLVPAFHQEMFRVADKNRAVLNIGGIANISWLPADMEKAVTGFDTGPGNCLLDDWIRHNCRKNYDEGGAWAASAEVNYELLQEMLADKYFSQSPPKSTGREYFNLAWIISMIKDKSYKPEDIQATLVELTVRTILDGIGTADEVLLCGGGLQNTYMVDRLKNNSRVKFISTAEYGVNPNMIEAMAFSWLARQRILGQPGNIPAVTGASEPIVLGAVY